MKHLKNIAFAGIFIVAIQGIAYEGGNSKTFTQTDKVLKNPLKGFMIWPNDASLPHKYVSMFKAVIHWNNLENSIHDGVEKIENYSKENLFDNRWDHGQEFNVEDRNIKVNPVVVIKKSHNDDFSPADMDISEHDNQTDIFGDRAANLVKKMAQAWDNDPRIGFVYMGFVGTWGEQYSIPMKPNVATKLANSFKKYFKHKKVLVRLPNYYDRKYLERHNNIFLGNEYTDYYRFGMYWDAFSWKQEERTFEVSRLINDSKLWVDQPILGEVAFNVPNHNIHNSEELNYEGRTEKALHDTLKDPKMVDYLVDYIHSVHATGLSWISAYNQDDPQEVEAAQKLQKAMGYRFVVTGATYDDVLIPGEKMHISLKIKNVGSAPFYYNWPLQVALIDKDTREVVYRHKFDNADIRKWLPGDEWDNDKNRYKIPAKEYHVEQTFEIPENLEQKDYILAIEIDDLASMQPSLRFANKNYYKDGRMPIAMVGVAVQPTFKLPAFDNIDDDTQINYSYKDKKREDNNQNSSENRISSINTTNTKDKIKFGMKGKFLSNSHFDYYIDADNNSATGYSNGEIKGIDYLIEDGKLYRYPKGARDWKWNIVGDIAMNNSKTASSTTVSLKSLGLKGGDRIRYITSATTPDWKEKTIYPDMESYRLREEDSSNTDEKVIFVIGDSTVYNREVYKNGNLMELGWADKDALGTYMKNPDNLFDEGRSGASSKSYKTALRKRHDWEETKALIKNSDISNGAYLLIQFGHNDESQNRSVGTAISEFYNELAVYVDWARDNGLVPVLITPVERRAKTKGHPNNRTHHLRNGDYAQVVRDLAKDKGVALLDLENKSWNEYNNYEDTEAINRALAYDDNTHFSPKGAKIVAGWVKELICQSDLQELCVQFK